ncbi:MAG: MBL fold metallo-hydrolase [Anaerolineae bacterium]|nr:MBL fold metallo-hydrolase [Anaerolineae bacterium]
MKQNYICTTCGVQYAASEGYPVEICKICDEDRQYVKPSGQQWTTLDALQKDHHNQLRTVEPNLTGLSTVPSFTIGQRPLLIQTPEGNVLWDCITLIDDDTVAALNTLGGVDAIAISHPHFYDTMVEWSEAFHDAPIYLHRDNAPWVMRPDQRIVYWDTEIFPLLPDITLIRCGGHFPGSSVLHWSAGADGKGVLMTGDTIMVVTDTRWVTFMYSYPNSIPLNRTAVERIVAAVEPFEFDRLYSGWWEKVTQTDAKNAVKRSAERYIKAISD